MRRKTRGMARISRARDLFHPDAQAEADNQYLIDRLPKLADTPETESERQIILDNTTLQD